jgi:iron complex transport system substrate-binding protein
MGLGAAGASAPRRIVSLAPAATEILYGVGAFGRVVADTEYCTYPPEAKALPKVGGWATPSVEKIVGFRPDLTVLSDAQAPFLERPLLQLGIALVIARSQTIADTFSAIEAVGKATGNIQRAADLAAHVKASLDAVKRRAAALPRALVLCIVDRTPGTLRDLYAAMGGSFLAELIAIAGGKAAGGASPRGYGPISEETVLRENPDVILDLVSAPNAGPHPEAAWKELPELNAVRRGAVHIVREDFVPRNSQRIAQTAVIFARLLHPEVPEREWEPR